MEGCIGYVLNAAYLAALGIALRVAFTVALTVSCTQFQPETLVWPLCSAHKAQVDCTQPHAAHIPMLHTTLCCT